MSGISKEERMRRAALAAVNGTPPPEDNPEDTNEDDSAPNAVETPVDAPVTPVENATPEAPPASREWLDREPEQDPMLGTESPAWKAWNDRRNGGAA